MANRPYLDADGNIVINAPVPDLEVVDLTITGDTTISDVPVPTRIYGSYLFSLVTDMIDKYLFTCPVAMTLVSASAVFTGNEDAGTVDIMLERCQGTEAPGSGDDLLSAAFDGTATDATVQDATLLTTAVVDFAAGDRLAADFTGDAPGELTGLTITWSFELTPA